MSAVSPPPPSPTTPRASEPELLVLHAVRLLGMAEAAAAAARFGLPRSQVAELLLDAEAWGFVTHSQFAGSGGWSLTDRGRAQDERLLAAELDDAADVVRGVHEAFLPLNASFQDAISRWQLRPLPGEPLAANDHSDHRWDDRVLADLRSLVARVTPLCRRLAEELQRFDGYDGRLAAALDRAEAGERRAVDGLRGESWVGQSGLARSGLESGLGQSARGESLHTVWFELHEDLVATLGITR